MAASAGRCQRCAPQERCDLSTNLCVPGGVLAPSVSILPSYSCARRIAIPKNTYAKIPISLGGDSVPGVCRSEPKDKGQSAGQNSRGSHNNQDFMARSRFLRRYWTVDGVAVERDALHAFLHSSRVLHRNKESGAAPFAARAKFRSSGPVCKDQQSIRQRSSGRPESSESLPCSSSHRFR